VLSSGFSSEDEPLIQNELCENSVKPGKSFSRKDGSQFVFKGEILLDHWTTSIGTKVYFTGYSEQILGRKFEYIGINKQQQSNSWLYKPLPMSLVRYERGRGRTAHPQCTYLGVSHVYGHIRATEYHSTALESACVHSIISLYHQIDSCDSQIKNSSSPLMSGGDQQTAEHTILDLKQDCETTQQLNETETKAKAKEINFLPYLIKVFVNISSSTSSSLVSGGQVERCLTVNETNLHLSLEPCVRSNPTAPEDIHLSLTPPPALRCAGRLHLVKQNQRQIYSPHQLFALQPTLYGPQVSFFSLSSPHHFLPPLLSPLSFREFNIILHSEDKTSVSLSFPKPTNPFLSS
jgi:hypothetical protein